MDDPKLTLQEYLITTGAPTGVLHAMRDLDELIATLDGYREAFWWLAGQHDFDSVDDMVTIVNAMKASTLSAHGKGAITSLMIENSGCDHSVGICTCDLYKALEDA